MLNEYKFFLIIMIIIMIVLLLLYSIFRKVNEKYNITLNSDDIKNITGSYYTYQLQGNSMYKFSMYANQKPDLLVHNSDNSFILKGKKWHLLNKSKYNGSIVYDLYDVPINNSVKNSKISITVDNKDSKLVRMYKYLSANTYYASIKNTIQTFSIDDNKYSVTYFGKTKPVIVPIGTKDNGCNNENIALSIYFNKPSQNQDTKSIQVTNCYLDLVDSGECSQTGSSHGCEVPDCKKAVINKCCGGDESNTSCIDRTCH